MELLDRHWVLWGIFGHGAEGAWTQIRLSYLLVTVSVKAVCGKTTAWLVSVESYLTAVSTFDSVSSVLEEDKKILIF